MYILNKLSCMTWYDKIYSYERTVNERLKILWYVFNIRITIAIWIYVYHNNYRTIVLNMHTEMNLLYKRSMWKYKSPLGDKCGVRVWVRPTTTGSIGVYVYVLRQRNWVLRKKKQLHFGSEDKLELCVRNNTIVLIIIAALKSHRNITTARIRLVMQESNSMRKFPVATIKCMCVLKCRRKRWRANVSGWPFWIFGWRLL